MFRWHIGIRGATLTAIVVGLLAIPDSLGFGTFVKIGIAAAAAMLTIWDAVANYSKKGIIAETIHFQLARARSDVRALWLSVDREGVDEQEMRQKLRELARTSEEAEHWAGLSELPINKKHNDKAAKDANKILRHRYFSPPSDSQ